jgi:hypothetical protein
VTQEEAIILDPNADQDCAEFQASMAELIGNGEDLQDHPHMLTCERCTALVRELETIAEVARQLLPIEEEPGDDLWIKLQGKLAMESSTDSESLHSDTEKEPEDEKKAASENSDDELGGLAFAGTLA